jgi:FMN phosphatase YigB (HAD superfamily)
MKYLLLDVAGTILHKPALFGRIKDVLSNADIEIDPEKLKYNHKILSEAIKFPDRTDEQFYRQFNSELLYSLGIPPSDALLSAIFASCSYLPWEKFADTEVLKELQIPKGIISNFNTSLTQFFGPVFSNIFVSETQGISKPSIQFYKYALDQIGIAPGDIIYIGDSFKLDLVPALALGINAYVIDRDGFYPKSLNTIGSLSELKFMV